MIPPSYAFKNLYARAWTSLSTAGGVALVTFTLAAVVMLASGVRKTLGASGRPDVAVVLKKGSSSELGSSIEDCEEEVVLASLGVAKGEDGRPLGAAELLVIANLKRKNGVRGNVQLRGVTPRSLEFRENVRVVTGRVPAPGTYEVMVGSALVGRYQGFDLGSTFELRRNRPFTVVGVFSAAGSAADSEVWADIGVLREIYGREGSVSSVRVRLQSPAAFEGFARSLEGAAVAVEPVRESTYYERMAQSTTALIEALGLINIVLTTIAVVVGAAITMQAAVASRQREIGTLRALGFSKSSILLSFLLEAILVASSGAAVGVLGAVALRYAKIPIHTAATQAEVIFAFQPTAEVLAAAAGLGVGIGIVGGLIPAIRAAQLPILAALRK